MLIKDEWLEVRIESTNPELFLMGVSRDLANTDGAASVVECGGDSKWSGIGGFWWMCAGRGGIEDGLG